MKLRGIVMIIPITLLVAMLSVLNADSVELNFYYTKTAFLLSVVVVVVVISGAIMGVIAALWMFVWLQRDNARI